MTVLLPNFDPSLLPRPTWKLRAAALVLAGFGGVGSIWLALDGQRVKSQEAAYIERKALLARLGEESAGLQAKIEAQRAQVAADEDRLKQARQGLAEVERSRASAASARDQAEADRFATAVARSAIVKAIEAEQQKYEQARAETNAARLELEIAKTESAAAGRNLDPLRKQLAAVSAELDDVLARRRERQSEVAQLTPEVQALLR
jgi:chromosome segregation ATPase